MNHAARISLPSARIRRRRLRFSPSSLRRRFRGNGQAILLGVWILVGLSTYGLAWKTFWYPTSTVPGTRATTSVMGEDASFFFSSLSKSKRTFRTKQRHMAKEETSKRLRKQTSARLKNSMENVEDEFTTIGFWIIVILWGFQKVKQLFPISTAIVSARRPPRSTLSSTAATSQSQITTRQVRRIHREVIVRTLRRINEEREARDEELISVDAIEAFQNALLQDQEIFEGSAEEGRRNRTPGATQEEIDACVKRLPNEHDDCECIICLSELASEKNKMLRVLPCNHPFHACCIDKWLLERSTQCPICKASIRNEDAT
ncbi:MAG: hypothetical protein SGBAC_000531 [Bacillariaceae sp.]